MLEAIDCRLEERRHDKPVRKVFSRIIKEKRVRQSRTYYKQDSVCCVQKCCELLECFYNLKASSWIEYGLIAYGNTRAIFTS